MSDERLIVTPDDLFSEEDRDIPNMRMSQKELELTFIPKPGGQWLRIRPTRSEGRAVSFCDLARIGVTLAYLEEIKYPQYRKKKDEEILAQHKETNRMLGEILNILKK